MPLRSRPFTAAAAVAFWTIVSAAPAVAATVSVGWDASTTPDVNNYQVCASLTPTCGGGVATIGNRLTWTFEGLADNRQYYFFVRALSPTGTSGWAQLAYATPVLPPAGSEQTRSDFNRDAMADLLWQNTVTNQVATWHMNGPGFLTSRVLASSVGPGWKLAGSGDLNQDGKPDLIWMHQTAGDLAYWLMDGTLMYRSGGFSFPRVDPNWNLVSVRDMNRDGFPDLVWHNLLNGQLAVWYLSGGSVIQAVMMSPGQVSDLNWKARGTADFTGDGWPDLLWQNESTGQLVVWQMSGHTFVAAHVLSSVPLIWKLTAIEDGNRDGWPDIVWHNEATGQLVLWVMAGTNISTVWPLNVTLTNPNWKAAGPR